MKKLIIGMLAITSISAYATENSDYVDVVLTRRMNDISNVNQRRITRGSSEVTAITVSAVKSLDESASLLLNFQAGNQDGLNSVNDFNGVLRNQVNTGTSFKSVGVGLRIHF